MPHSTRQSPKLLRRLVKSALVALLVAAPAAAISAVNPGPGSTIEAPAHKKMGAGFVLMVSLRRA